ncbi:amidase domain-containing protein [Streptomyces sp. NRRL S-87]|uniref:amidase domain-containing protein n=1 Tax=Streptomyces sp. NRRL S-87 TaxID=1463920 RepID=UPI0004C02001|nr:amidase domain-containing protein [Streptomyces sp. NRRL S-87]
MAEVDRSAALPSTQISEPVDDGGPINEPGSDPDLPDPEPALEGPITDEPSSTSELTPEAAAMEQKVTTASGYNYANMAAYARKYAIHPNPVYIEYSKDCTNFISQALLAGGWKTTSGGILHRKDPDEWFFGAFQSTTSYARAGAHNWYWYATKYSHRTKILDNMFKMGIGDVLQIDFAEKSTGRPNGYINYTMMVTAWKNGEPYLSGHTNNVLNKPLTVIKFENKGANFYAHRT